MVIEDFHYMPEQEKRNLAFDLKAFWDLGVFFIIVGIWAEHNLLAYYNNDLSGRVEEIDVMWVDAELNEVLTKGEQALNVIIPTHVKQQIIADASQNVGLLQRIAERFCFYSNVLETLPSTIVSRTLDGTAALQSLRKSICDQEIARYRQFGEAISHGFRSNEDSELKVYANIARAAVEAKDEELRDGMHYNILFERVQIFNPRIRRSDLTAALKKLNRLQEDRQVSPLVLSYNDQTHHLQLVDRELLFFRKYGSPTWPWSAGYDGDDAGTLKSDGVESNTPPSPLNLF